MDISRLQMSTVGFKKFSPMRHLANKLSDHTKKDLRNMGKKKLNRTVALAAKFTEEEHQQILKERQALGFTNTEYIRNKILNTDLLYVNHVVLLKELSLIGRGMYSINLTLKESIHLSKSGLENYGSLEVSLNEYLSVQRNIESLLTRLLQKMSNKK